MKTKAQRQTWATSRKRKGLCLLCASKSVVGKTLCERCALRSAHSRKAKEVRYLANGQCVKCGSNAVPGRGLCVECKNKNSFRAAIKKMKDPRKIMVNSAKRRAQEKNLPFDLVVSDFEIPEFCPVLGITLKVGVGKQCDSSPTLDRIVPSRGYVRGNVKVISWRANNIRGNASAVELEKVAHYAYWADTQVDVETVGRTTELPADDALIHEAVK
jgi:hypothetical protein